MAIAQRFNVGGGELSVQSPEGTAECPGVLQLLPPRRLLSFS